MISEPAFSVRIACASYRARRDPLQKIGAEGERSNRIRKYRPFDETEAGIGHHARMREIVVGYRDSVSTGGEGLASPVEITVVPGDLPGEEHVFLFCAASDIVNDGVAALTGNQGIGNDPNVIQSVWELPRNDVAGTVVGGAVRDR